MPGLTRSAPSLRRCAVWILLAIACSLLVQTCSSQNLHPSSQPPIEAAITESVTQSPEPKPAETERDPVTPSQPATSGDDIGGGNPPALSELDKDAKRPVVDTTGADSEHRRDARRVAATAALRYRPQDNDSNRPQGDPNVAAIALDTPKRTPLADAALSEEVETATVSDVHDQHAGDAPLVSVSDTVFTHPFDAWDPPWTGIPANSEAKVIAAAVPAGPHWPTKPATHAADGSPLIYLTFDDGPHEVWTPRVLEALADYGAIATFFVTGAHTTEHPELVARTASAGHGIENHTYNHLRLDELDADTFRAEVQRTDRAIQAALGADARPVTCLRAPFGAFNDETGIRARELGKWLIGWDYSPQDWLEQDPVKLAADTLAHARPGSILLFHDTNRGTAEALPAILTELSQRGYQFALLCE